MKTNKIFKFLSSVKLAIPLMAAMTGCVAYGTIVESRYNTDMARLVVYHTVWFQILLCLLWINIFCATLSRIPFKKHHTGFIITHIGLLTLLIGSLMTSIWGIDGQLQVVEKSQNNEVVLPELVFEMINRQTATKEVFEISRSLKEKSYDDFKNVNDTIGDKLSILSYMPFARVERTFKKTESGQLKNVALNFRLKNSFFDVNEWLHSEQSPQFQMGPAHIALIVHGIGDKSVDKPKRKTSSVASEVSPPRIPQAQPDGEAKMVIVDSSGGVVKEVNLNQLKGGVTVNGVKFTLVHFFEQAVVGGKNKIEEGGQKGANPALELSISKGGKTLREVAYAKFSDFSLNPNGAFGYKVKFSVSGIESSGGMASHPTGNEGAAAPAPAEPGAPMAHGAPDNMPNDSAHSGAAPMGGMAAAAAAGGNVIQFHVYEGEEGKAQLKLLKGETPVLEQWVNRGETVQTPWMGIQLTLNQIVFNGTETQEVKPTDQAMRTDMPPSAILVKPAGAGVDDAVWLMEGDARDFTARGVSYQIYYGRKTFKLPFSMFLNKFTKKDYPGTETPMSFESLAQVNHEGPEFNIHMNEPLVRDGYTLYQASYVLRPGEPAISVFSVNWDPGRWVKYIGSLILIAGIITFTLMRSRLARAGAT